MDIEITLTIEQARAVEKLLEKNMAGNADLVYAYDAITEAIADAEDEIE